MHLFTARSWNLCDAVWKWSKLGLGLYVSAHTSKRADISTHWDVRVQLEFCLQKGRGWAPGMVPDISVWCWGARGRLGEEKELGWCSWRSGVQQLWQSSAVLWDMGSLSSGSTVWGHGWGQQVLPLGIKMYQLRFPELFSFFYLVFWRRDVIGWEGAAALAPFLSKV